MPYKDAKYKDEDSFEFKWSCNPWTLVSEGGPECQHALAGITWGQWRAMSDEEKKAAKMKFIEEVLEFEITEFVDYTWENPKEI